MCDVMIFLTFVSTHCDKSSQIEVVTCLTVPEHYSAAGTLSLYFNKVTLSPGLAVMATAALVTNVNEA